MREDTRTTRRSFLAALAALALPGVALARCRGRARGCRSGGHGTTRRNARFVSIDAGPVQRTYSCGG